MKEEETTQQIRDVMTEDLVILPTDVGILTIGDFAIQRDAGSALADISAAEPTT